MFGVLRLLVFVIATVCMSAAAGAEAILRVKVNAEFTSLDPVANLDFNARSVVNVLLEGLVAYREDASVGLMLADDFEISPDGRRYLFTLRDGVTFHNGAPLDADAVVFSWRRYLEPSNRWRCLPQFNGEAGAKIIAVEAPNPRSVLFELDRPFPAFLERMARLDCASAGIFHRSSLDAEGKWLRPIGTGPFKLGEIRRGEHLDLDKFAEYKSRPGPRDGMTGGKAPLVDKVRLTRVSIENTATALFGGLIDVDPDLSTAMVDVFLNHQDFTLTTQPSFELIGLLFQTMDPLLSDPRIRRAVLLALDREGLSRVISQGRVGATHSPIPSGSVHSSALERAPLPYDPAQARLLLAEAGYAGQTLKLSASRRYMTVFLAGIAIQDMLRQVGFAVELEELEWEWLFARYGKGEYQMMMFPYSARLDPALSYEMLVGSKSSQPHKVWDDALAIELVQRMMDSGDPVVRRSLLDQLHRRFVADLPMIPLWNPPNLTLRHKRVKGFEPWVGMTPRYWGVWLE